MSVSKAIAIAEKGMSFDIIKNTHLFPPIEILNAFLQCGVDDAASEVTLQWQPFSLVESEYDALFEYCVDGMGELIIDRLGADDYSEWFSKAAVMN